MILANCSYSNRFQMKAYKPSLRRRYTLEQLSKIGIDLDAMPDGTIDILDFPKWCVERGIPGIEVNNLFLDREDEEYAAALREAVTTAGGQLTCFTIDGNLCHRDAAIRREQIAWTAKMIQFAKALGAPRARVNLGWTRDPDMDRKEGIEWSIEGLKELLPTAKECNMPMLIENHGGPSASADQIIRIIEAVDPEWIGSNPDFGNFPSETRYEELEKAAPYAKNVHAKTRKFNADGDERDIDFPRCFKILRAVGFDGPICIEFEGESDAEEGILKTKALIEKYW